MAFLSDVALLPSPLDRITKPFDRQTLLAKIETSLGRPAAEGVTEGRKAS